MPRFRSLLVTLVFLVSAEPAFGALEPSKAWYAPGQPIVVTNTADEVVEVRLTDFIGRIIDAHTREHITDDSKSYVDDETCEISEQQIDGNHARR
ncbi:MAG: hypothetical protein AAF656_13865, partial [Planctomycetota bacterium]